MEYNDATGDYQEDFLSKILNTEFLIGVPYKIDREKYNNVCGKWKSKSRFKTTDTVVCEISFTEADDLYCFSHFDFFLFPRNRKEESDDFYDCFQFDNENEFKNCLRDVLDCFLGIDREELKKMIRGKLKEMKKNIEEIHILNNLI